MSDTSDDATTPDEVDEDFVSDPVDPDEDDDDDPEDEA